MKYETKVKRLIEIQRELQVDTVCLNLCYQGYEDCQGELEKDLDSMIDTKKKKQVGQNAEDESPSAKVHILIMISLARRLRGTFS